MWPTHRSTPSEHVSWRQSTSGATSRILLTCRRRRSESSKDGELLRKNGIGDPAKTLKHSIEMRCFRSSPDSLHAPPLHPGSTRGGVVGLAGGRQHTYPSSPCLGVLQQAGEALSPLCPRSEVVAFIRVSRYAVVEIIAPSPPDQAPGLAHALRKRSLAVPKNTRSPAPA
jgi:hypothetical protein